MNFSSTQNKIGFAINLGSLANLIGRDLPIHHRNYPAFIEKHPLEDGSLIPVRAGSPAFDEEGCFLVEPESTNLLPWNLNLKDPEWYKGSHAFVLSNQASDNILRSEGDLISFVSAPSLPRSPEEVAKQSVRRVLNLTPGKYTVYAYFMLHNGLFGSEDKFRVVAGDRTLGSVGLEALNDSPGAIRRLEFEIDVAQAQGTEIEEIYIEIYSINSVTLAWRGGQIEAGDFRTSLIYQHGQLETRPRTEIYYPYNPVSGLATFGVFAELKYWRGNGNLVDMGDFKLTIEENRVKATMGSVSASSPVIDPDKPFKVFAQAAAETQSLSLYLDGILVSKQALPGLMRVRQNPLSLTSQGVRSWKRLMLTNALLIDGGVPIGGAAIEEVADIFLDAIVSFEMLSSTPSMVLCNPVAIPAAHHHEETGVLIPGYASVRLPFAARDVQEILSVNSTSGAIEVGSALSFTTGDAIVQSSSAVLNVKISEINRATKTLTIAPSDPEDKHYGDWHQIEVGSTISQIVPHSETIVSDAQYLVDFLIPNANVGVASKSNDGFILYNSHTEATFAAPMVLIAF